MILMKVGNQKRTTYNKVRAIEQIRVLDPVLQLIFKYLYNAIGQATSVIEMNKRITTSP